MNVLSAHLFRRSAGRGRRGLWLAVVLIAVATGLRLPVATRAQQSQYLTVAADAAGSISVSWRNTPGNNQDWVSVVHAGVSDDTYESTWAYTGGQRSGSYNAGKLAAGSYEARLYLNWPDGGYNVVDRLRFTAGGGSVTSPPGPADLTGLWQDNVSGAIYRVRQIGRTVTWAVDGTNIGSYANVFVGTIDGTSITGNWTDLPGSPSLGGGTMTLRVDSSAHLVKVSDSPCCYAAQEWFRLT